MSNTMHLSESAMPGGPNAHLHGNDPLAHSRQDAIAGSVLALTLLVLELAALAHR